MSGVTKRDQKSGSNEEETTELRRGPWTLEEDSLLIHYIARHGEGRWNMLAKSAGLKRNGKSCRLRWLNYLKPDIKRGNLTPQEQLLILELHSRWGNRWSKIAQHLPGRTDNEIKNYWRTRVQKQARQLNIESGSKKFMDAVRCFWMPRLIQKVEQKQDDSSLTSTNLQVPSEPPNHSAFPSLSPAPSPLQPQDHYIPSNFPSDSLQFSQPLELSSEIPSTSHSPTPTCWFDQNSVDYYSNLVQDGWCGNYSSNGYGLMEGVNQEAMSGIESYDVSQFDYYQNAENDQWVFGNMGDSLWNMDSM